MNTVAPVWDGNETWLVLGGAGLLAAFPLAYSVILSAFYLPLILMLIGLIFRGVAFEFRFKASAHRRGLWDLAFIGGSSVATFFQGVTLGGFIEGIPVRDGRYAGGAFDWLNAFSLFTGLGLLATYALLGSTWLIMKTDGLLRLRMRLLARTLAWVLLLFIGAISLWTPLAHERIAERWFSWPNLGWFMPVPVLVLWAMWRLSKALAGRERQRAVHLHPGADLPGLQRPGHQPVAAHRAAEPDDPRRRRAAAEPGLRAGGRAADHSVDPDVHGLGLLGVSRQGAPRRWVSLMDAYRAYRIKGDSPPRRWLARLAWLGLFWVLGVASMGLIAGLLRALMRAAGLGQ